MTPELLAQLAAEWGEVTARHTHLDDGFSIVATRGETIVGLIGVKWETLPPPLQETAEAYIDIIGVREGSRRQGVARGLLELAADHARAQGAYQLRAWSSRDKSEAIPMWQKLGFTLCPATQEVRGQTIHGYYAALVL